MAASLIVKFPIHRNFIPFENNLLPGFSLAEQIADDCLEVRANLCKVKPSWRQITSKASLENALKKTLSNPQNVFNVGHGCILKYVC